MEALRIWAKLTEKNMNDQRAFFLDKRDKIDVDSRKKAEKIICEKLLFDIRSYGCETVLAFMPIKSEVNLIMVYKKLLNLGYKLYFPVSSSFFIIVLTANLFLLSYSFII